VDVAEASTFGAWSTINLGVIDLDATELPSNDRDIYEAVLERMLADSVELEIVAPEAAMSGISSFAEAVTAASGEPVSDTVVVGQPVPS
jgi:hypothetical protein